MTLDFYIRHSIGFAMQLIPGCVLLLLAFDEDRLRKGRMFAYSMLIIIASVLSLIFPVVNHSLKSHVNMGSNIYMLLSIIVIAVVYFCLVSDSWFKRLSALLCVIVYASLQYSLSNVLMFILPVESQSQVYSTNTVTSYIIVTLITFPFIAVFFCRIVRPYLATTAVRHIYLESALLLGISLLYMIVIPIYSGLWVETQWILGLGYSYYIPFVFFMTVLLMLSFYCTMKLTLTRTRESEYMLYAAILKQGYDDIRRSMDKQRGQLHDVRQLLATMSSIAENGTKEDLLKYIQETTERTKRTDIRYCLDPCLNGVLQYYAGILESSGIPFTVKARCDKLPFDDADMTILISNAMENAIRSTTEYNKQALKTPSDGIRFTAGIVLNELAVQIENPCLFASISHRYNKSAGTFLPADAFMSITGGGVGLRRMESIAKKYSGDASFCFDGIKHTFTTRLTLSMHEMGGE